MGDMESGGEERSIERVWALNKVNAQDRVKWTGLVSEPTNQPLHKRETRPIKPVVVVLLY